MDGNLVLERIGSWTAASLVVALAAFVIELI